TRSPCGQQTRYPGQSRGKGEVRSLHCCGMPMRRARVLVVDDPKRALSAALDRALLRHQVDAAHSALDAIYCIDCARLPYDVVLCDVVRGDLPGPELWAFLSINRKRAAERMVFVASTPLAPEARAFLDRV